jgi:8-oxo-dGTP pyrophosphatase MutT (NUDIX family)
MSSQEWIPGSGAEGPAHPQCAALCWRLRGGRPQVLLITSRDTRRWILPKGWLLPALSPREGAGQEAWEEAGVRGALSPEPIGAFTYLKRMDEAPDLVCLVSVFGLQVERLERRYPERRIRRRKWFALDKAAGRVGEPELRDLIRGFHPAGIDGASH